VFHQYAVRSQRRDAVKDAAKQRGIATNIHYPMPVHLQPAYRNRVALGPLGLKRTETVAARVLSLPMYPQMDDAAVKRVVAAMKAVAQV